MPPIILVSRSSETYSMLETSLLLRGSCHPFVNHFEYSPFHIA